MVLQRRYLGTLGFCKLVFVGKLCRTTSAVLTAVDKISAWRRALQVCAAAATRATLLDVVCCTTLVASCGKAGQWLRAANAMRRQLLDRGLLALNVQYCTEKKSPKKKSKIPKNSQNGRAPRASRAAHAHSWGIFRDF